MRRVSRWRLANPLMAAEGGRGCGLLLVINTGVGWPRSAVLSPPTRNPADTGCHATNFSPCRHRLSPPPPPLSAFVVASFPSRRHGFLPSSLVCPTAGRCRATKEIRWFVYLLVSIFTNQIRNKSVRNRRVQRRRRRHYKFKF